MGIAMNRSFVQLTCVALHRSICSSTSACPERPSRRGLTQKLGKSHARPVQLLHGKRRYMMRLTKQIYQKQRGRIVAKLLHPLIFKARPSCALLAMTAAGSRV